MKKILITKKLPIIAKALLAKKYEVDEVEGILSKKQLIEAVKNYHGLLTTISEKIDKNILSHAEKLEVISNYAIGLDNIDVEYAEKKNIFVYNLPDIVTNSTADLTLALLLSFVREILPANRFVVEKKWNKWTPSCFCGEELYGKIFGIIGFGRIGQAVAKRAISFGMKILFFHYRKYSIPEELKGKVKQVSFEELLKKVDYLSLHMPLNEKTKGMISLSEMKKMKKKPLLINMARGAVVKTEDLLIALQEGYLKGAALDVTDPEPLPLAHPLCSLKNCLVVPHIGTATKECRYAMAQKAAKNLLEYFEGKN